MATLILLISLCGAVLVRQGPFLINSSYNQLVPGLVPFVDIQSQESSNEASSLLVRVTPAEKQITSVKTALTPGVHQDHNDPSYPPRNEATPSGESPDFDIEDEYSLLKNNEFDNDRFTENYFEYEQGQKDIIEK